MQKFTLLIIALLALTFAPKAQCVIDTTHLTSPGVYPAASALPHIIQHTFYDQTVQGKVQSSFDTTIFVIDVTVTIDSIRLDSIQGLPTGINFTKNPTILKGGGYGCVEFTGTTTDTAGTYNLTAFGMAWAHGSNSTFGIDTPITYNGNLNQYSPFGGYYLVVDTPTNTTTPLVVVATIVQPICSYDSGIITVNASGGNNTYSYAWSNHDTTSTVTNLPAGNYYITVTSGAQTVIDTAVVVAPTALSDSAFHLQIVNCSGDSIIVVAYISGGVRPYTYAWSTGSTDSTTTVSVVEPYTLSVQDANGCAFTDSNLLGCTGIFSVGEANVNMNLYPNPAANTVHVTATLNNSGNVDVKLYDLTGRILYNSRQTTTGLLNMDIDVQNYTPAIYFIELTTNGQTARQKFSVQR